MQSETPTRPCQPEASDDDGDNHNDYDDDDKGDVDDDANQAKSQSPYSHHL